MLVKEKSIFNWSGGKDSALCLYKVLQENQHDVMCLLTSISEQYKRVSMHGVRVNLLEVQADKIGIPLIKMKMPEMSSMENYENIMRTTLTELKKQGVTTCIFGDIFLEDLRTYRETKLAELNLKVLFPLWKIPSAQLIREFIGLGFKAIITCVNEKYLDKSFAGRIIDNDFLNDLPGNVDPCGENGEFHTFVFDGPVFKSPIPFYKGEIVYRKHAPITDNPFDYGFWYCDLLQANNI